MILSPAERSFLHESLTKEPIVRPDSRKEHQYRPIEAKTSFLPTSNGSARIRLVDGSECIVSVKSQVVSVAGEQGKLIECDVDVGGHRDDSNFVANLRFHLTRLMNENFPQEVLKLTKKYAFKLFIDCIVISHSSYPLSFISLACYLALKTTRLPLLVSDGDDEEVEEQPTFSDDWEQAPLLASLAKSGQFLPPIFVTVGVVGKNVLFDPSVEEEQVLENGLAISWYQGNVIAPFFNLNLSINSNNSNFGSLNGELIVKSMSLAKKYCGAIVEALDSLIEQDRDDGTIF